MAENNTGGGCARIPCSLVERGLGGVLLQPPLARPAEGSTITKQFNSAIVIVASTLQCPTRLLASLRFGSRAKACLTTKVLTSSELEWRQ